MEFIDIIILALPIFAWGMMPVLSTVIGGKPIEQSLGIALGSFVFALFVLIFKSPPINLYIFFIGLVSGLFWGVGSICQYQGIHYIGVSKAMPISNGTQIIGTSLFGLALGEWASNLSKVYGFVALALIIVGTIFTSYKQQKCSETYAKGLSKGIPVILLSSILFSFYVGVLKFFDIEGWSSLFSQSIGQILGIALVSLSIYKFNPFTKISFKNTIVGIIWAVGNIGLLLSQTKVGLAVAFPVSQAAILVSIFGGVFINKEKKNKREWTFASIGMVIIVLGLVSIYFSSLYDI